jgi:hypothetical protein
LPAHTPLNRRQERQRRKMNYQKAIDFVKSGRSKVERTYAKATTFRIDGDNVVVRYHHTDIITFKPDGSIHIYFNGYHTMTTRRRISDIVNVRVWGANGMSEIQGTIVANRATIVNGIVTETDYKKSDEDEIKDMKKKIKKYCKEYSDEYPTMNPPDGGDCWYCALFGGQGSSHLLSHMEDKYYVPSLLPLAANDAGYNSMVEFTIFNVRDTPRVKKAVYRVIYKYMIKVIITEMIKNVDNKSAA